MIKDFFSDFTGPDVEPVETKAAGFLVGEHVPVIGAGNDGKSIQKRFFFVIDDVRVLDLVDTPELLGIRAPVENQSAASSVANAHADLACVIRDPVLNAHLIINDLFGFVRSQIDPVHGRIFVDRLPHFKKKEATIGIEMQNIVSIRTAILDANITGFSGRAVDQIHFNLAKFVADARASSAILLETGYAEQDLAIAGPAIPVQVCIFGHGRAERFVVRQGSDCQECLGSGILAIHHLRPVRRQQRSINITFGGKQFCRYFLDFGSGLAGQSDAQKCKCYQKYSAHGFSTYS